MSAVDRPRAVLVLDAWAGAACVRAAGVLATFLLGCALALPAAAQDAASLRARHDTLRAELADNAFQRPIHLDSTQTVDGLRGDVHAVVEHPYATVQQALQLRHWCDILILHLNVKHCRAGSETLAVDVGRKFDQPLDDAHRIVFGYRVVAAGADYLQVRLTADEGPFSTRNYRFAVEAIPLDDRRSFIHMSYAYGYGMAARMAIRAYLATLGRDKVGFSVVGRRPDGAPVLVDGVLGLLERNTMRYYLAIDAYLDAYALPRAEQPERRIRDWWTATERYARQLHELDQQEYLAMKRKEMRRMTAAPEPRR